MENSTRFKSHQGSWKIARVLGVDLKVHWSLVFLLLYVVLLSAAQLPYVVRQSGLNPAGVSWNPWLFGLVFALGLFLSVVAHEMGHVLVAQAQGVRVQGITLMMLGGVSEMGQVPEKDYAELKLAIIGPLVSLVISGLMWLTFIGLATKAPKLSLFAYWLADINLVLAIFNLIPALPLDGGRVLRSFLAVKQGSLKATQNAVKVSQVFAWVLGLMGFLQFNFFLILIAFFVYSAAQAELVMLISKAMMTGMSVKEAMTPAEPLSDDISLHEAALHMLRTRNQVFPIRTASGDNFVLSLDSIRSVPRESWRSTLVSEVMQPASTVLNIDDPINQAVAEMASSQVQALPVQKEGKIVGILKYSDLSEMMQFKSLEESSSDQKKAA